MKTNKISIIASLFIATSFLLTSCDSKKENVDVTIVLEHFFNTSAFNINTNTYVNGSGDSLTFSTFKYYISNIQLLKDGGDSWTETESYRLVDLSDPTSTTLTLAEVPADEYTGIKFLIGVDSTRNVSGAQTGALDPVNDMFWSWSSGYIFLKAEGTSPQSSTGSVFSYHIGGFQGANSALQWVELDFGTNTLIVEDGNDNTSHINVDVKKMFDGSMHTLSVAINPSVTMPGMMANHISENYSEMFEFDHNHN